MTTTTGLTGPHRTQRWRRWGVACTVLLLAASGVAAAQAVPGQRTTSDGDARMTYPAKTAIDGRDRPSHDAHRTPDVYLPGDAVKVDCQTSGDLVGGSRIWIYTSTGHYIPDYLVKTGTDGFIPGVRRCAPATPTGQPSAQTYPAKTAIDGRDRPSHDAHRTPDVYLPGDAVEVDCQTSGDLVGGSRIWIYTSTGYYIPDYLLKTGTDGFIPGVRRCAPSSQTPTPPASAQKPRVVAIGDSWASGEGSGDYDPLTNRGGVNECHRSRHAWQRQVALPGLGLSRPENGSIDYVQMSCSGAKTPQLWGEEGDAGKPWLTDPQQTAELKGTESHVLIGTGGNDLGFAGIVVECTASPACDWHPSVRGLRGKIDDHTRPGGRLDRLVRRVHDASPKAKVVLMGYPKLFGTPPSWVQGCAGITPNESNAVDGAAVHLADRTRQQVDNWKNDGIDVVFVDPIARFSGHEACTWDRKWINTGTDGIARGDLGTVFHPTHEGHRQLALLASEEL